MKNIKTNIPKPVIIKNIEENTPQIKTFILESYISNFKFENPIPGQFFNLWIPNLDMKPFSISGFKNNLLSFTIKKIGKTTTYIHENLKIGDKIGLIGPLGNGFKIKGNNILLIGGGIGIAPLKYLLEELIKRKSKILCLLGFKVESDLLFIDYFKKYCNQTFITTEDGCMGEQGFCTDLLDRIKDKNTIDQIYCCGPEQMMIKVFEFSIINNIEAQFSLERYFGCGIGLCGSCSLNGKFRVCMEGPVADSNTLKELSDFGKFKLTRIGTKTKI
ncbi:MAG: dihydroorotate dehydrogenase electron transfer subunit [Candidatus Helarchaeota archaeon]